MFLGPTMKRQQVIVLKLFDKIAPTTIVRRTIKNVPLEIEELKYLSVSIKMLFVPSQAIGVLCHYLGNHKKVKSDENRTYPIDHLFHQLCF